MCATMKRPKTKHRMSHEQLETLISYMEGHSLFARGQITKLGPQGHLKYQNMWKALANDLNKIGPCQKNVTAWQEAWKKLRRESKKRKAAFLIAYNKTGHINPDVKLKEFDERITDIFGKYGLGLPVFPESGVSSVHFVSTEEDAADMLYNNYDIMNSHLELKSFDAFEKLMLHKIHQFAEDMKYLSTGKKNKPTNEQKNALLEFMQNHQDFARNPTDENTWTELLEFLHGLGPVRSLKAWQRTWVDYVRLAEQAATLIDDNLKDTPLTEVQEIVLRIIRCPVQNENSCLANLQMKRKQTDSSMPLNKMQKKEPAIKKLFIPREQFVHFPSSTITSGTLQKQQILRRPLPQQTAPNTAPLRSIVRSIPLKATASQQTKETADSSVKKSATFMGAQKLPSCTPSSLTEKVGPITKQNKATISDSIEKKSVTFLGAFKQSQQQIINQITECFEKQNQIWIEHFNAEKNLLTNLPHLIAEEVTSSVKDTASIIATDIEIAIKKTIQSVADCNAEKNSECSDKQKDVRELFDKVQEHSDQDLEDSSQAIEPQFHDQGSQEMTSEEEVEQDEVGDPELQVADDQQTQEENSETIQELTYDEEIQQWRNSDQEIVFIIDENLLQNDQNAYKNIIFSTENENDENEN